MQKKHLAFDELFDVRAVRIVAGTSAGLLRRVGDSAYALSSPAG